MDIYQREGNYPIPKGASTILGVEFSGVVAEIGSEVTKHKAGDEVFGITGGVSPTSIVMQHLLIVSQKRAPMRSSSSSQKHMSSANLNTFRGLQPPVSLSAG